MNSLLKNENNLLESFRNWFLKINEENYFKDFTIENSISEIIQKDFLESKNEMNIDDFDRFLNLTKLFCLSQGKKLMTFQDYLHIKNMEKTRKEKLVK